MKALDKNKWLNVKEVQKKLEQSRSSIQRALTVLSRVGEIDKKEARKDKYHLYMYKLK